MSLSQEDLAYIEYLRQNGAGELAIKQATNDALREQGLTGQELQDEMKYVEYQRTGKMPESTAWDLNPLNPKVWGTIPEALDYGSNLGRGAAAGIYQGVTGENLGVDAESVFKGNTPSVSELARRAGVPEMDFAKNIAMQSGLTEAQAKETTALFPSGRSIIGFAGDVALDPTTWLPALKASKVGRWAKEGVEALPKRFADIVKGLGNVAGDGISSGMRTGGKKMYVSGLKELDEATKAVGQAPVSEVLWKHGVTGDAKTIEEKAKVLQKQLRDKAKDITKRAKDAGAEVDMNLAMRDAQIYVNKLREMQHPSPQVQKAIDMLQNDIDTMRGAGARIETKELPFTMQVEKKTFTEQPENVHRWYDAPTEGVSYDVSNARPGEGPQIRAVNETDVNNVYAPENPFPFVKTGAPEGERELVNIINNARDKVKKSSLPVGGKYGKELEIVPVSMTYDEAIPGPNPEQVSAWKTMDQNAVGSAWDELARSNMGKDYTKAKAAGERKAVEESVNILGPGTGLELQQTNDELGRLLTSRRARRNMTKKEKNVNNWTSVDGMLLGAGAVGAGTSGGLSFAPLAVKKASDVSKTTGFRTRGGKLLNKMGTTGEVMSPEGFWRQILLTPSDRDELD